MVRISTRNDISVKLAVLSFAALIPWQFFFNLYGHIDLPVTVYILTLGFVATLIKIDSAKTLLKIKAPILGYCIMLAAIGISSLFMSKGLNEPLNVLGRLGIGLLILIMWSYGRINITTEVIVKVFLLSAIPLGILGVVFYIEPEMEEVWSGMIFGLLTEPDSSLMRVNIKDPLKVGIVFLNANTGAVFWGISMWLSLWLRERNTGLLRLGFTVFAVIFCFDVMAAGSRAGILALLITMTISIVIRIVYSRGKTNNKKEPLINTAIIIATLGLVLGLDVGLERDLFTEMKKRTLEQSQTRSEQSQPRSEQSQPRSEQQLAKRLDIENKFAHSGSNSSKVTANGSNKLGAITTPIPVNTAQIYAIRTHNNVTSLSSGNYYFRIHYFSDIFGRYSIQNQDLVSLSSATDGWIFTEKTVGPSSADVDITFPEGTRSIRLDHTLWSDTGDPVGTAYMDDIAFLDGKLINKVHNGSFEAGDGVGWDPGGLEKVTVRKSRKLLWNHSVEVIKEAPIFGHGVINFADYGFPWGQPPHNMYLQIWIYGGLAAIAGLFFLYGSILVALFKGMKKSKDIWVAIPILSWVIIQGMFTNLLISNYRISMLLWLMMALFIWDHEGEIAADLNIA